MSLTLVVLVLSASSALQANQVPQGQVRGVLTDGKGHPFAEKVDVLVAKILDEASGKIELNTSWKSPLDDSGAFLIKNVPPGNYCLVLFFKLRGVFGLVLKEEGKRFSFELPQNSGVDLERVDASRFRLP